MSQRLEHLRVWVARPEPQASRLAACLSAEGADVWVAPLLEIEGLPETSDSRRPLLDLDLFDHVVVTSAAAAQFGLAWIENSWPQLPVGLSWWAIGTATADVLTRYGVKARVAESGFDSEALLAETELQSVAGQRVLLLTGEGGRELLADTLRQRGAQLLELPLYRRVCPHYPSGWLLNELTLRRCNWIVVTSGQLLNNLLEYLSAPQCLARLLVPSERLRQQAVAAGFNAVSQSLGASDQAVLDALLKESQSKA